MSSNTVIEFVGLCVFTSQLLSPSQTARLSSQTEIVGVRQVVAIMPFVPAVATTSGTASPMIHAPEPATPAFATAQNAVAVAPTGISPPAVDAHTAMIAFRSCDLLSADGWAIKKLDDNGWLYIELSGEHLSVIADTTNATVNSLNSLPLHHLNNTLTLPYSPSAYSGAAAIFTIANGTLSTCSQPPPAHTMPRVDTKLTLNTINNLTIATSNGDKKVTVRAGARIIAANVPLHFAQTGTEASNAHNHFMVYCYMTGQTTCPPPLPVAPAPACDFIPFAPTNLSSKGPPPSAVRRFRMLQHTMAVI